MFFDDAAPGARCGVFQRRIASAPSKFWPPQPLSEIVALVHGSRDFSEKSTSTLTCLFCIADAVLSFSVRR